MPVIDKVISFLEFKLNKEISHQDTYKKNKKLNQEYRRYLKSHNITGYYFDGKKMQTLYEKKR